MPSPTVSSTVTPTPTATSTPSATTPARMILELGSAPASGSAVTAGQVVSYTFILTNAGDGTATGIRLSFPVPAGSSLIPGAVDPPPDPVWEQGRAVSESLIWSLDQLAGGGQFQARLAVRVNGDLQVDSLQARLRAVSDQEPAGVEQTLEHPLRPTAVLLTDFMAVVQHGVSVVTWQTSLEVDTLGFHLWRTAGPVWQNPERITREVIPARPGTLGGRYAFEAEAGVPGETAYYWLEELTIQGGSIYYGPTVSRPGAAPPIRIFLPIQVADIP